MLHCPNCRAVPGLAVRIPKTFPKPKPFVPSQPWQKAASRSWYPTATAGTAFEKPRPGPAFYHKSPCSSHHCRKPINVAINHGVFKSMASDPAYDPAGRVSVLTKSALALEESGLRSWSEASARPHALGQSPAKGTATLFIRDWTLSQVTVPCPSFLPHRPSDQTRAELGRM